MHTPDDRTLAGELAVRSRNVIVPSGAPAGALLDRQSFTRFGRAIIVEPDGRVCGIVSVTDIERRMRAADVAGAA